MSLPCATRGRLAKRKTPQSMGLECLTQAFFAQSVSRLTWLAIWQSLGFEKDLFKVRFLPFIIFYHHAICCHPSKPMVCTPTTQYTSVPAMRALFFHPTVAGTDPMEPTASRWDPSQWFQKASLLKKPRYFSLPTCRPVFSPPPPCFAPPPPPPRPKPKTARKRNKSEPTEVPTWGASRCPWRSAWAWRAKSMPSSPSGRRRYLFVGRRGAEVCFFLFLPWAAWGV